MSVKWCLFYTILHYRQQHYVYCITLPNLMTMQLEHSVEENKLQCAATWGVKGLQTFFISNLNISTGQTHRMTLLSQKVHCWHKKACCNMPRLNYFKGICDGGCGGGDFWKGWAVWIQSMCGTFLFGLALHCEQDISEAINTIKSHCLCQLCWCGLIPALCLW